MRVLQGQYDERSAIAVSRQAEAAADPRQLHVTGLHQRLAQLFEKYRLLGEIEIRLADLGDDLGSRPGRCEVDRAVITDIGARILVDVPEAQLLAKRALWKCDGRVAALSDACRALMGAESVAHAEQLHRLHEPLPSRRETGTRHESIQRTQHLILLQESIEEVHGLRSYKLAVFSDCVQSMRPGIGHRERALWGILQELDGAALRLAYVRAEVPHEELHEFRLVRPGQIIDFRSRSG